MSHWSKGLTIKNNGLVSLQKEMNDFFDSMGRNPFNMPLTTKMDFSPNLEMKEDEKSYTVVAELPGMKEEDIHVTLRDNYLILEGEKKNEIKKEEKGYVQSEISYGSFYRSVPLAAEVNPEKVTASYKDGVLNVQLEKTPIASSKTRKIHVKKT